MTGSLSELQIADCRWEAQKILKRFHVRDPQAIDVETFAWLVGKLKIKIGGLSSSEGRLVATKTEE